MMTKHQHSTPRSGGKQSTRIASSILSFLQALKGLRPAHRTVLLSHLDENSCETLYETISNVLCNTNITSSQRRRLKKQLTPHKDTLRFLSCKRKSPQAKKKRLTQMGGFPITTILSTAIPLLTSLIKK